MDAAFDRLQAYAVEGLRSPAHGETTRLVLRGPFEESAKRMPGSTRDLAAARVRLARIRMKYACHLERAAVLRCEAASNLHPPTPGCAEPSALLWFDSYAASVWVDALAAFLLKVEQGCRWPPTPGIEHTSCCHASRDISCFFDRRNSMSDVHAATHPLISLIQRATSPGSRGWIAIVERVSRHRGSRSIVQHLVCSLATGSHPCVRPSQRRPWEERLRILLQTQHELVSRDPDMLCTCSHIVREAVRLGIAVVLEKDIATMNALSATAHPATNLHIPPSALPRTGLRESLRLISKACWEATRTRTSMERALRDPAIVRSSCSWLGKGTPDVKMRQTLKDSALIVLEASFRSSFVPLWALENIKGHRIQTLTESESSVALGENAISLLCSSLPQNVQLAVQRLAFRTPSSASFTLHEAASAMGLAPGLDTHPVSTITKNASKLLEMASSYGAENAAKIFHFARASHIIDCVRVVSLGETTKQRQVMAILRRHKCDAVPAAASALRNLPMQASHLCLCTHCRRVANCIAVVKPGAPGRSDTGKRSRFTGATPRPSSTMSTTPRVVHAACDSRSPPRLQRSDARAACTSKCRGRAGRRSHAQRDSTIRNGSGGRSALPRARAARQTWPRPSPLTQRSRL